MPRDLILGTAGHIDHGKTSLVRALTGIDTDRLPEEKARGITIDIGFAHLDLGDFRLGIVDVPGHERFVRNMLAGATGIDVAVLIVAADDSVMPQTREHLDILRLLGVRHGVIALTKADLVDDETRQVVELEIRDLVQGTFLTDAAVVPTAATKGVGVQELKGAIEAACRRITPLPPLPEGRGESRFRLPIDRAFVVQGHGTVVTGSVIGGGVEIGDELEWHKGDGTSELVRVRGLNNHSRQVDELHRGQRGAINLAGVPHDAVRRGQELATPGTLTPSQVLTVRLTALATTPRGIKHRLPLRLHLATAEVMATVSLLDADRIQPGATGFAQLFLDAPVVAAWGQPFVLRDSSAEHTLGGGIVLQPVAKKLRRGHVEALTHVEQLTSDDATTRATADAWFAGSHGLPAGQPTGQPIDSLVELTLPPGRKRLFHPDRLRELEDRLLATLATLHADHPLMTNHDRQAVLARLDYVGDDALLQAVADRLVKQKKLVGDARRIARADFKPKLSANQRKLKDRIVDEHLKAGLQPPEPGSYANLLGGGATTLGEIFEVACAEGHLVRVTEDIYLHAETAAKLRTQVTQRLRAGVGATVSEIRDLLGTTRKYAIPICEYLDRVGLTKRAGDLRVLNS